MFRDAPKQDLGPLLPHLKDSPFVTEPVINLLDLLFAYEPSSRLSAQEALEHPWFHSESTKTPLVLPAGYPTPPYGTYAHEGKSLRQLFTPWMDVELQRLDEKAMESPQRMWNDEDFRAA